MTTKRSGTKNAAALRVVEPETGEIAGGPPADLDGAGLDLWRKVTLGYVFDDPGSWQLLAEACYATSRAARCRAQITEDGEIIKGRNGAREHPLLRAELGAQALAVRLLVKLGLDLEPLHSTPGRPPGARGG